MHQYSSIFLQRQSDAFNHLYHRLIFLRFMGGGPRTFLGGLKKCEWRRLHENQAREKEKRLLDHEKQLYQARLRSRIRSKMNPDSGSGQTSREKPKHEPLSRQQHIKALADRFMKEGAEDLWNEDDGPSETPPPTKRVMSKSTDLNKILSSHPLVKMDRNENAGTHFFPKSRNFSSYSTPIMGLGFTSRTCGVDRIFKNKNANLVGNTRLIAKLVGSEGCEMRQGVDSTYDSLVDCNNFMQIRCYSAKAGLPGSKRPKKSALTGSKRPKKSGLTGSKRPKKFYHARNDSSMSEDVSDSEGDLEGPVNGERFRTPRYQMNRRDMDSSNDDSDEEEGKQRNKAKRMMSSAALGKHYITTKKSMPLQLLEDKGDLPLNVEKIREELSKRTMEENAEIVSDEETIYSSKRFDEYDVSPLTVKALSMAGYVQTTRVQEATLTESIQGKDVLVKAKTGTGKSIAFLIPAIETVLKSSSNNGVQRVPPVCVLILSPTRELACQIAAEAAVLLKYHDGIDVQTLIGGTRLKDDQQRFDSDPCQIIVATAGRLLDHIENKSSFSVRLMGLKMLILDEADYLLDLGFRKDLEKIVDCLPRQRQTLLFSATVPKEVRRVSQLVLKKDHTFVDIVGYGLETPAKIKQSYIVGPHDKHFQMVYQLLTEHISETADYKVMVFCTTANITSLLFSLLRDMKLNVREMHSRKPQLYRTSVSEEFMVSKRLVLVTSEVSGRGMNYPDVTLVIQVGVPVDREQYIHRVGRTGRKDQEGQSIILLAPWERYFLFDIKEIPVENRSNFQKVENDVNEKMEECFKNMETGIKEGAYLSWLGYYNSIRIISRDKTRLVELANQFCESIGLPQPPAIRRKTIAKMGLTGIPGIREI